MSNKTKTIDKLLKEAIVNEEEQPYEIPDNWTWVRTKTTNQIVTGSTPPKKHSEYYGGNFPFVKPADLEQGSEVTYASEYLTKVGKAVTRIIPKESTMVCCIGSIGKTGFSIVECATNQQINSLVPNKKMLNPKFNYYQVLNGTYQNELWNRSSATTVSIINKGKMSLIPYVLPPFNEQKRIAKKVERLLGKIDEAKRLIVDAKETFEIRRAAILDKAFTGELTKTWRGSMGINNDNYLDNIFNQKRSLYEKLLKEAQQEGLKKPSKLKFYGEPDKIDSLAVIPDSWNYTYLGNVIYNFKYGTSEKSSYENDGNPVIRIPNIGEEYINLEDMKYLTVDVKQVEEKAEIGDLLIIRSNGSRDLVGKCAIVDEKANGYAYASYLIRMRAIGVYPKFIYWLMKSNIVKRQLFSNSKSSAGINNINTQELASIVIPIPSKKEQIEIVNAIESLLFKERKISDSLSLALKLDSLKQSILSKAFKGELGTNDFNDEPAIELLKSLLQE